MQWSTDWVWGLPLILLTMVGHVFTLGLINERVVRRLSSTLTHIKLKFSIIISISVLLITVTHAIEIIGWAIAYWIIGALPQIESAVLYSMDAMTTYGHENFDLAPHWQLLGGLEALNGVMLFGLTTAFLFAMIQEVGPFSDVHR